MWLDDLRDWRYRVHWRFAARCGRCHWCRWFRCWSRSCCICADGVARSGRENGSCRYGARLVLLRGLMALWIALASPIDALDDYLLAAHMMQHFILMSIAPPLIVLGAPVVPLLAGIAAGLDSRWLRPVFRAGWLRALCACVTHPVFAWLR